MVPNPGQGLRLRLTLVIGAVAGLGLVLAVAHVADVRLLRTPPDEVVSHAPLRLYAELIARPAFLEHCARCHGLDLRGRREKHTPDLTDRHWLYGEGSVSDIERTVLFGIRSGDGRGQNLAEMPAFLFTGRLTPQDISDVSAYVLALQARPARASEVARGQSIFDVKGVCYDCHGIGGVGDPLIGAPDLRASNLMYGASRADIVRSISEGRHGLCPAWISRASPAAIRALAVMIHDSARPS